MVKIIVGLKGSGKTKTLIDMANHAGETSQGSVVCVEKGNKLLHEIKYYVRLIDVDQFDITSARSLYGFLCGIYASNHDITDIFIDGTYAICERNMELFSAFVREIEQILSPNNVNVVLTASMRYEDLPEDLRQYVLQEG